MYTICKCSLVESSLFHILKENKDLLVVAFFMDALRCLIGWHNCRLLLKVVKSDTDTFLDYNSWKPNERLVTPLKWDLDMHGCIRVTIHLKHECLGLEHYIYYCGSDTCICICWNYIVKKWQNMMSHLYQNDIILWY